MKRIGVCFLILFVLGVQANEPQITDFLMTPLSKILLGNIDTDSAFFTVYSPGKASGICGLVMISMSNHEKFHNLADFLTRFEISTAVSSKRPLITQAFTRFSLLNENLTPLYMNTLKIRTKDGHSISENIRSFYGYMAPIAIVVDFCKSQKSVQ